jgi:hypothetical protein
MKHKFEHMLHQVAVDKEQEQTFKLAQIKFLCHTSKKA